MTDPSLANGLAGLAVTHLGLAKVLPGRGHRQRAKQTLERALGRIAETGHGSSLFQGFTGIAWAAAKVTSGAESDSIAVIDEALEDELRGKVADRPYDLVDGLVGIGVYAIERLPRPAAKRLVGLVVKRLVERPPHRRERVDIGVAHGIPGVFAFLGCVLSVPVDARTKVKARALLDDIVPWFMALEVPSQAAHAWCYGDPGIAVALSVAAHGARKGVWMDAAMRIGLAAAAREVAPKAGGGLCHGAAGLAQIFRRLHGTTGERAFERASDRWLRRALSEPRAGIGFLTGAAGVALALVASVPNGHSDWDRVLLVS